MSYTEKFPLALTQLRGAVPDGIAFVDEYGVICHTNKRLAGLTGYAPDELVGQTVAVIVQSRCRILTSRLVTNSPGTRSPAAGDGGPRRSRSRVERSVDVAFRVIKEKRMTDKSATMPCNFETSHTTNMVKVFTWAITSFGRLISRNRGRDSSRPVASTAPRHPSRRLCAATSMLLLVTGLSVIVSSPASASSPWNWSTIDSGDGGLTAVSCVSGPFCMAVDELGYALSYNGTSWTLPSSFDGAGGGLTDVSCVSSTFCMAVDELGYALKYNGTSWTHSLNDSGDGGLTAVSCVSTTFCMAVDYNGDVLSYNGTSWNWSTIDSGDGGLTAVSCVSTTFCMAVDYNGNALSYNGTSWTSPSSFDGIWQLTGVSCVSSTFCMAVDNNQYAWIYNGSWSPSLDDAAGEGLTAVSCVSGPFCMVVDNLGNALSYDPSKGGWATSLEDSSVSLNAVSCVSSTFCMAVSNNDNGNAAMYNEPATATVTLTGNTTPAVGVATTYTATVTGAGTTPSGTVTFYNSGTAVGGSCTTDTLVGGVATCSITFTSAGSVSITASYSGQTNIYATVAQGSSVADAVTVGKGTATVTLTGNTTPAVGVATTYTATVTGAGATPSGTVTFYNSGTAVGGSCTTDTLVGGVATCSITFTSAGSVSITASYVGDANYAAVTQANSVADAVTVGLGSASVVVTGSAATVGAPDTFTATVSGAAGTPTGNVNFYEGATEIVACENVTLVSGAASCAYTFTTNVTTPIAITASYTGETNVYATVANGSSTSYSAVIGLGTATVTLTGNTTPAVGVATTYTATVTGAGATPSGTVTFYNSGTAVGGSCTTDTLVGGVATCSITFTSAGSVSITASYVGDANYAAVTQANSVADAVTVGLGSASVVVTGSAATVGAPDTFTATVSGAAGTPTGNVNFYEGATEIVACENVTLVSGAASCAYTFTTNVTTPIAITASYTGETNVYATVANGSSTSYSAVIGLGTATVTLTGNTTPAVGVATTYTATVTGAGTTPSGTVTFYNSGTAVGGSCTTDTLVGGVATCSITFTSAGSVSITASYSGQTNIYATVAQGSSVADAVTVGKGTATVTLTGNTTPAVGVATTYTATVTGAGATPSGTVTFYNAGTAVGGSCTTDTLVGGVATCSITFTSAGSVSITASYVGDANYAAVTQANSVAIPVRVAAPTGPTNAPPPTNPSVPASSFGTPTSVTASCAATTTVSETSGGANETITVPQCALPSGTTLSAYPVINTAPLVAQVPAGSSYVLSFAVTWEAPNGTSPTATAPITMTITDLSIVAGDTIYELTSTGLVAVGTAAANGTVTITFSSDPIFLVSHTTPVAQAPLRITTLSGTVGTALTLVTSGGSGSGAVSFAVTNGTATGCRITGSSLTATGAGKCLVTATKAADSTYLVASSSATTVRFTAKVIPVNLHATRVHRYAAGWQDRDNDHRGHRLLRKADNHEQRSWNKGRRHSRQRQVAHRPGNC